MKKCYFFLASVLMAFCANAAATQLYLIGEPAGGWSPLNGTAMTQTEDGVFTIDVQFPATQYFGFSEQLGSTDSDWATMNGSRYGATTKDAVPVTGDNEMLFPSENSWKLPAGDYTFTVNTNTKVFTLGGNIDMTMGDLYLRGNMNNWLNEGLDDTYKFTTEDNSVYTLNVAELEAGVEFKIGTSDWGYGFSSGNLLMNVDQYYATDSNGNMAMATTVSDVTITLDVTNGDLIISKQGGEPVAKDVYVVGAFTNTWDLNSGIKMNHEEGTNVYTLTTDKLTGEWKLCDGTWDWSFGAGGDGILAGVENDVWFKSSLNFPAIEGDVSLKFILVEGSEVAGGPTPSKLSYTINIPAGVDNVAVEASEAAAVYYNLQGVRISAPEAGVLYIVERGGKVTKEIAR